MSAWAWIWLSLQLDLLQSWTPWDSRVLHVVGHPDILGAPVLNTVLQNPPVSPVADK